jgi:hypothetical protein
VCDYNFLDLVIKFNVVPRMIDFLNEPPVADSAVRLLAAKFANQDYKRKFYQVFFLLGYTCLFRLSLSLSLCVCV